MPSAGSPWEGVSPDTVGDTPRPGRHRGATARWGRRLLIVAAVLVANFALPRMLPGDPLLALADPSSAQYIVDPELLARVQADYGLDRPLPEQLWNYLRSVLTGDLGWSIGFNRPVAALIGERIGWTLGLVLPALAIATTVSIVGGLAAGWRRGSRVDHAWVWFFTLLSSVPSYLIAVGVLAVFSLTLGWAPLGGAVTPFGPDALTAAWWGDLLRHWLLPATTLTLSLLGARFLLARTAMVTTLAQPYLLVARAKGLPDRRLRGHHAARNALLPVVTALGPAVAFAVGGSIVIETVYAYPGLGLLVYQGVQTRDYPLLQGAFLITGLVVLVANWTVDALYRRLDPRTDSR